MKKHIWRKNGNNVAKKQELFNCLLFAFLHTFQMLFTFSIFKTHFFTFFPSACSKRIFSLFFTFFTKMWKQCEKYEKMHFENALGEKREKCVLKMHLEKNVKNKCWKMWKKVKHVKTVKKCENCEKCEKMWKKTHLKIQLGRWNLDFLGSSFAAVTLLPAQLLQVENRRGAVQIDRKWTVQIADLFNISIAKQWLPGAKT